MSAMITRAEARERFLRQCGESFDRRVPADKSRPVCGETFQEWENQADEVTREIGGTFLETMAQLDAAASMAGPGVCRYCGSENTRFLEPEAQRERQSKHGPVVLPRQVARCRPCGRTFSPSGLLVGDGWRPAADA